MYFSALTDDIGFFVKHYDQSPQSELLWPVRHRSAGRASTVHMSRSVCDTHDGFLCAEPVEYSGYGVARFDRSGPGAWETFELELVDEACALRDLPIFAEMARLLTHAPTFERICLHLEEENVSSAALGMFALLLDETELALGADAFIGDPQRLATYLSRLAPNDPWLGVALPALSKWLDDRRPSGFKIDVGSELDSIGRSQENIPAGFGQAFVPCIRCRTSATRTLCLVASVRNEGPYLTEWIAYHLDLGFEHIFIYSNDNIDGSDDLLSALEPFRFTSAHIRRGRSSWRTRWA